jgi:hypothetical protein
LTEAARANPFTRVKPSKQLIEFDAGTDMHLALLVECADMRRCKKSKVTQG